MLNNSNHAEAAENFKKEVGYLFRVRQGVCLPVLLNTVSRYVFIECLATITLLNTTDIEKTGRSSTFSSSTPLVVSCSTELVSHWNCINLERYVMGLWMYAGMRLDSPGTLGVY